MSHPDSPPEGFVEVAPAETVREEGPIVVSPDDRSIAPVHREGAE